MMAPPRHFASGRRFRPAERGSARATLLLGIVFFLCLAASAYWFYAISKRAKPPEPSQGAAAPAVQLSDATRAVLDRLDAPLEIRFYSILDPASVPGSVNAFADRVDQVLAAYQQESGGKIKVTRFSSQADISPNAPAADGVQPFNIDKGEPCYLGVALALKGHKESLSRLSPDWEQAIEPDITRAIARLEETTQPVHAPTAISQVNTAAVQEVKALIPDVAGTSLQDAQRMIQTATLKDLNDVKKETDARVREAEQHYREAQTGGSEADKQAARQQLSRPRSSRSASSTNFTPSPPPSSKPSSSSKPHPTEARSAGL